MVREEQFSVAASSSTNMHDNDLENSALRVSASRCTLSLYCSVIFHIIANLLLPLERLAGDNCDKDGVVRDCTNRLDAGRNRRASCTDVVDEQDGGGNRLIDIKRAVLSSQAL